MPDPTVSTVVHHAEFIDWAVKAILAASFGGWAWVVKVFGDRHIISMSELGGKIDKVTLQLADINLRLSILEHDYENKIKVLGVD